MLILKRTKGILFLVFILSFSISCEQQNENFEKSDIELRTDQLLLSQQFKGMMINENTLEISQAKFITSDKRSILIPFKGLDDRMGLIGNFDQQNSLLAVTEYHLLTDVKSENVYSKLSEGKFFGSLKFRNARGEVILGIENSKLVSEKIEKSSISGRTALVGCNGITERGGAYDCAGARFEEMNWFDQALCVVGGFVPCMAQLIISCAIDGCVV